jgi:hypothetical protein
MVQVTHEQVYSQINNGDIMYVDNWGHVLPRLIQFFTKSRFSHVGILFWMVTPLGQKRLMIVEAQGGTTLRVQDFDFYCKRPLAIVAAPKDWSTYEAAALERIGQVKYSYLEAIYVGLRDFCFKYLGFRLPKRDFPGEICSEFVARCLGLDSVALSPQDLFDEIGQPVKFTVRG